ncbi:MAG: chordopoxvirus fusion protein [Thermodesulfovibrio sp.]
MLFTVEVIEELQKVEPPLRDVFIKVFKAIEKTIGEVVKREDFIELKKEVQALATYVKELAEAQKRTEERINELAEAQKRTEERVTRLETALAELAEAQKRTEERINELAEAQKRTEERVTRLETALAELAEAQKRTEKAVEELTYALKETRQMVGNLSDTVGYTLEDRAMKALPEILFERFGIKIKGRLIRKYIQYNGKYNEINIYGEGERQGQKITVIGEAKSRLSKNNVDNLIKLIDRLQKKGLISGEIFPLVVTYTVTPEVQQYSFSKGVHIIWSYEI